MTGPTDNGEILLSLTPTLVAEIMRLVDLQPIEKAPPQTFWHLQTAIADALRENPEFNKAVLDLRSAAR